MKRALVYASVASMIQQFNMNNIKLLQKLGYEVDVACNFDFGNTVTDDKIKSLKKELNLINVNYYNISVPRKIGNLIDMKKAYKATKDLINQGNYSLIHCHSPIGGIICRFANKNSKNYNFTKMIYTAHGFHFFKGNNALKNFVFKSVEKYASNFTDVLVTINKEDYEAANKFKLKEKGQVKFIPGIGIDIKRIDLVCESRNNLLNELGLSEDTKILLSVGELSKRKNHETVIKVLNELPSNVHYLICGKGELLDYLMKISRENQVLERVHFLGYCDNIYSIMKSSDVFVFPSLQEGLPVALMEAIACGMPCVASRIRGNVDFHDLNVQYFDLVDNKALIDAIKKAFTNKKTISIPKIYSVENIMKECERIYDDFN